jgi:hypothetical protein
MKLEQRELEELEEDLRQRIVPGEFTEEELAEFRRRIAAIDSGETELLDGEQVMRELRERFKRK